MRGLLLYPPPTPINSVCTSLCHFFFIPSPNVKKYISSLFWNILAKFAPQKTRASAYSSRQQKKKFGPSYEAKNEKVIFIPLSFLFLSRVGWLVGIFWKRYNTGLEGGKGKRAPLDRVHGEEKERVELYSHFPTHPTRKKRQIFPKMK